MKLSTNKSTQRKAAIVGMGCRFPGSVDKVSNYWDLLKNGIDGITSIPDDRRSLWESIGMDPLFFPDKGGFLSSVDQFDPSFFNVSPREAEVMDPQQRLLAEVTYEAFENAGIPTESVKGSLTGVFVGQWTSDYENLLFTSYSDVNLYMTTGTGRYASAGRLAYLFDLRGPCMTIDTACSSSLVAAHLGSQGLIRGDCDIAIVAGVNLILTPFISKAYLEAGILSPEGRSRFGDRDAKGYVRSEGCGVVILKRYEDALQDRDRIYALISGGAVNNDGRLGMFVSPSIEGQKAVLRSAYEDAGVSVDQLCYIEAHGTGTAVGDPIEVTALGEFLADRHRKMTCPIGSVKTNIGHTEAAAGVAGLIKAALVLHHREIPPSLHCRLPNPQIDWSGLPVSIATHGAPIDAGQKGPLATGINSFGITGTNAHLVLQEVDLPGNDGGIQKRTGRHAILTLSGRSKNALLHNSNRMKAFLEHGLPEEPDHFAIGYNSAVRRSHHEYRRAIPGESIQEWITALGRLAENPEDIQPRSRAEEKKRVAFIFSGQGPQWHAMGRNLYLKEPVYREVVDQCSRLLAGYVEWDLVEALGQPEESSRIGRTDFAQPAIFALQMGLAALWKSWGIVPDAVIGHSIGEIAAACTAGILSLQQAVEIVYHRGRVLNTIAGKGEMAALALDAGEAEALIQPYNNGLEIAAVNSPKAVTVSGETEAVRDIVRRLEGQGVFARILNVGHAFHSRMVDPVVDELVRALVRITAAPATVAAYSTVTGKMVEKGDYGPGYWGRNIRNRVRFMQAALSVIDSGIDQFLEIGPHPIHSASISECLSLRNKTGQLFSSLRRGREDTRAMADSLSRIYEDGYEIKWRSYYAGYHPIIDLPSYAWQRESCWMDRKVPTPTAASERSIDKWRYQIFWQPLDDASTKPSHCAAIEGLDLHRTMEKVAAGLRINQTRETIFKRKDFVNRLEVISCAFICRALKQLGWSPVINSSFTKQQFDEGLGIARRHRRLSGRLLDILCEDGFLAKNEDTWSVIKALTTDDPLEMASSLLDGNPVYKTEITLLQRCASNLAEVLAGEQDPLELLFPEGTMDTAETLYQDSPFSRECNQAMEALFRSLMGKWPKKENLRILEIGAGTGGTSAHVLPFLPDSSTDYVFTDVANLFLTRAGKKFRSYDFLQYRLLDIEQPLDEQNFETYQFDMVLAANVLHATADLGKTLGNVRKLLKPGGLLVLLEGTSPRRWVDLVFGLLEGWWRFSDRDLRPSYALMEPDNWSAILHSAGFENVASLPITEDPRAALFDQSIILSRAGDKAFGAKDPKQTQPESLTVEKRDVGRAGTWILFSDNGGVGETCARDLRNQGYDCISVKYGDSFNQINKSSFMLPKDHGDTYHELMAKAAKLAKSPIRGILYLWSLDTPSGASLHTAVSEEPHTFGCGSLLSLVQAIIQSGQHDAHNLWVVTRGAQSIESQKNNPNFDNDTPSAILQACLWGMGRVVPLEHPNIQLNLADLDPESPVVVPSGLINALIASDKDKANEDRENQIAFRKGTQFVARLCRKKDHQLATPNYLAQLKDLGTRRNGPLFQPDRSYLIAGGFNGLGLLLSRWMVKNGAKFLALIGRKGSSKQSDEDLAGLTEKGITILKLKGDICKEPDVRNALSEISSKLPPLKGIFHCASALDDGVLSKQTWDSFKNVLGPKVAGAWNLHTCTESLGLDYFVLYSSYASIMGSAGAANYAAANSFMDALAHYRRSRGLSAVAINWGIWSGEGHGAIPGLEEILAYRGIKSFRPSQGLEILKEILVGSQPQEICFPLDINRWFQAYPNTKSTPYLSLLSETKNEKRNVSSDASLTDTNIRDNILMEENDHRRQTLLQAFIQEQMAGILRVLPSELNIHKSFKEIGLDSLTGLELSNKLSMGLAIKLPATAIWNYPTIEKLSLRTFEILGALDGNDSATPSETDAKTNTEDVSDAEIADLLDELDDMTDEEVRRMLSSDPSTPGVSDE